MMTRNSRICALAVAMMAAFISLAAPKGTLAQGVRSITNVATAEWGPADNRVQSQSNQVKTIVNATAQPVTSAPYTLTNGGFSAALLDLSCARSSQTGPSAPGGNSGLTGLPISEITQIIAGQSMVLGIDRPALNLDPAAVDSIQMVVRTNAGDEELLNFVETAPDSGRFVVIVRTHAAPASTANDCRLGVAPNSTEQIRFSDTANGPLVSSFAIPILIDPYGVVFDSRDGAPVAGVSVSLINVATGQPAQVFGDDGFSSYPSTVITGQAVTDAGGTVYTFPPGDYRFPLVAPGTYRWPSHRFTYTFARPRPPCRLRIDRPHWTAYSIAPASYGLTFRLSDPAPVRIDIPLDRPHTTIVVEKTASVPEAQAGDIVQYRVVVRNPDQATSGALVVNDVMPAQMRFRLGSARIDGTPISDPTVTGRELTFTLPSLAAQASLTLTSLLEVRPDASEGEALNRVSVTGAVGIASNVADAVVRIKRETISQRLTIIGRVIDSPCGVDPASRPACGRALMMEDGSSRHRSRRTLPFRGRAARYPRRPDRSRDLPATCP